MYKDKINFSKDGILKTIYPYIKDKDVLDIGCVEHSIDNKHKKRIWVHDFLKENARHVTGIDILKNDIKMLKKQGYDVYCKSAEFFKFNKKFDVIFAGELIEHLSNPGLFLEQCKKHLNKKGYLILTTPNAFSITRALFVLKDFTNDPLVNIEHSFWFSPTVLKELLSRYNFTITQIKYTHYPQLKPNMGHKIVYLLCRILGKRFRETMVLIIK